MSSCKLKEYLNEVN